MQNLIDVDLGPVAEVLEHVLTAALSRDAEERAKHLSLTKDLVDAVNNLPVPTSYSPVNVEPSRIDLMPLVAAVATLQQQAAESTRAVDALHHAVLDLTSLIQQSCQLQGEMMKGRCRAVDSQGR